MTAWLALFDGVQFEPKIFHPEFSLVTLAGINVFIGCFILVLLALRRCFPMNTCCRFSLREFTTPWLSLHASLSFAIWLGMLLDARSHDRSTIVAMGINVFLYLINRVCLADCDRVLEARLRKTHYDKAMDDSVMLYGMKEIQCKEVITDGRILRSFLTVINLELNRKHIHDSEGRHTQGHRMFEDLLARERLHNELIHSPHVPDQLDQWLYFDLREQQPQQHVEHVENL